MSNTAGNPTLIQELETAKILQELSQRNHGTKASPSQRQSQPVKKTMIKRKRKLSNSANVDLHTISPVPNSVTAGRPVSPSTSETDFSIPQIEGLGNISTLKVNPLAPPPKLRRVPVHSPIIVTDSKGGEQSKSPPPGQYPGPSLIVNGDPLAFSQNMLLQILSNQMINSSHFPTCLPVGSNPSLYHNNSLPLALSPESVKNQKITAPTLDLMAVAPPTVPPHQFPQQKTSGTNANKKRKACRMEGCDQEAARRTPYCAKHCGPRKCEKEGCTKCAQGRTRFCIAHGGGRRCQHEGCTKGARDRHFCAFHGGGRRCNVKDCSKLAVGKGFTCTAHGGGRRCQHEKCTKSAQSSSNFCVRHGGGRKCKLPNCTRVARGKIGLCMSHASQQEKFF